MLAEVLIGGGLRISEALALEWADVNWDTSTLAVTKSFKVDGLGTPKGNRGHKVAVDGYVLNALGDYRLRSGQHAGLVFTRVGSPIRRQYVHRYWHRYTLEDAGLPIAIRLHVLRHTAATLWLASGQSIYFVKEQLGHRDIQTTIDLYGHPDQETHRRPSRGQPRGGVENRLTGPQRNTRVPPAVPRTQFAALPTWSLSGSCPLEPQLRYPDLDRGHPSQTSVAWAIVHLHLSSH